jgi:hypothetical protein
MRALRERPRLAAARAVLATLALVAAALGGAASASRGPDVPADVQRRMERAERQVVRSQRALSDSEVEGERLRRGLVSARRQARRVARDNARVENELRQLRRALARAEPSQ